MLKHGIQSLDKMRRLAWSGLALPLPLIVFSIFVFNHYLQHWYKDPFVLGILVVFLVGQAMAVNENLSVLRGLRKSRNLLLWLQSKPHASAAELLQGLGDLPGGHLHDVVTNSVRTTQSEGGASVQSVLDNAANRRMARDARTIGLQVAVNRTTLKLGFLGTLIGLLLTFTPMKEAILALRDSGGEMKFVTDIAKAIDGDYFAIYTTLLATGLSLLIEMITLQLLERALGRFETMNSFVDEWLLVELEPRLKKPFTPGEQGAGLHSLQTQMTANLEQLARAVADTTRRIEDVLRVQESLGRRVDLLLDCDRDARVALTTRLDTKGPA